MREATGHHVTAAEADAWLAKLESGQDLECGTAMVLAVRHQREAGY